MKHLRQSSLALGLIACLLLVGVFFASQTPAHAFHHSHHKASTHASLLCSWMCAAGQVDQTAEPILESPGYVDDFFGFQEYSATPGIVIRPILPRGPPVR